MADFMWAVAQMKEGKEVRRKPWDNNLYICLGDSIRLVFNGKPSDSGLSCYDCEATDWEIYEEKKSLYEKAICTPNMEKAEQGGFHYEDVKQSLKEFIDICKESDEHKTSWYKEQAKQIFGDKLI